jgi:hypothetical protein
MLKVKQIIDLRDLFSVSDVLLSNGFLVTEQEAGELLVSNLKSDNALRIKVFNAFNSKERRKELFELCTGQIQSSKSEEVKEIEHLLTLSRDRYTNTFEWYIGELFVVKFKAFSYSYGITIDNIIRNSKQTQSGDFDVIAILRNTNIVYCECKSGKMTNVESPQILKWIERGSAIHAELSIMVLDDIIDEQTLTWNLEQIKHPINTPRSLTKVRTKKESVPIYEWGNSYFVSSKANIEEQLRLVFRFNNAKKMAWTYANSPLTKEGFSVLGYDLERLKYQEK